MPVTSTDGSLRWTAGIDDKGFQQTILRMEAQMNALAKTSNTAADEIDKFGKKAAVAIGSYLSLTAGKQFVSDLIRVRGEFQQLEVAFTTMLGSKEKADQLMKEAIEFAAATPFSLGEVAQGAKQLLAYGFAVETMTKDLNTLGNIAAGVSAPLGDIVYLYGTLKSQGRAYSVDIRQFAARGIPIYEELAKVLGVSASEVTKLVEAGKVGFPQVEKAFQNLTGEGGKFFNLMQEQSKTLTGLLARLGDAWQVMLNDIGKDNEGIFASGIKGAINLVENYQTVIDILKVLVLTYGTYRAALIVSAIANEFAAMKALKYTAAETLKWQAMVISERATKLLNATMLSNPYVAAATGIAAIVTALVIFNKTADSSIQAQERLNDMHAEAEKNIIKEKVQVEQFLVVARDENQTRKTREEALRKAIQTAPEYLNGLTLENLKTQEGVDLIRKYVEALRSKARAQAAEGALVKIESERIDAQTKLSQAIEKRIAGMPDSYKEALKKSDPFIQELREEFDENIKSLDAQSAAIEKSVRADLDKQKAAEGGKQVEIKRTVAVIQEEIKALQDRRDQVSQTGKEYKSFTADIRKLETELEGITGKKAGKGSAKQMKDTLDDLKALLEEISQAEGEAARAGLTTADSEIDRINSRYDALKKKVEELKIDGNKKGGLLQRIENARGLQVGNEKEKNEAEEYKKFIEQTKDVFDRFEEYKLDVGKDKAQELTNFQTAEYEDYIEFIKTQLALVSKGTGVGAVIKKDFLVKALADAEKDRLGNEAELVVKQQKEVIEKTITFNGRRKQIEQQYQKDLAALRKSGANEDLEERETILKKQRDEELQDAKITFAESSKEYQKLFEHIEGVGRKVIKQRIKNLREYMAVVAEEIGKETNYYKQLQADLTGLTNGLEDGDLQSFARFADLAGELGQALQGATGDLSIMGDLLVGLTSQTDKLTIAFSKTATQGDKIAAGIGAVVDLIALVINAANKRKQAEEEYYASIIGQQEQYNLLLNDQLGIQSQLAESVFVKDFEGRMVDGFKKLSDASEKYQETLKKLAEGQAKLGQRNAVDWGAVGQGAVSGVAAGAAIGSVVPVIGTAIGAVVGGIVGGLVGLFGGMKKEDVFGPLLAEYPELIKVAANGWEELNVELAKSLVEQGLIDEQTKQLLQSAIEWTEQIQEAKENMKGIISELAGNLGSTLRTSLVDAFKSGESAAKAFSDSVSKTLEDMLSQLIFSKVFSGAFKGLEDDMMKSFDFGGDGSWVDDFGRFFAQAEELTEDFNANLEAAQQAAGQFNIDVFRRNNQQNQNSPNALVGAFSQMSEETGNLIAGQFGGLRVTALSQLQVATQQLTTLNDIRYNTSFIELSYKILGDLKLNGIKIKP
ncbi:tape measure protein [Flavitalea antarctica]